MDYPYLPIIYVRGFAFNDAERLATVDDPYMGFNLGSARFRHKHDRSLERLIFESPLLRLMKDFKYQESYNLGAEVKAKPRSLGRQIFIYRYYEKEWELASEREAVTGSPKMVDIARELAYFIRDIERAYVRAGLVGSKEEFKINLVAHSMGGLICRCLLQNEDCRNIGEVHNKVHKVFTYGTPHNGIDTRFLGNAPNIAPAQIRNFNRDYMRLYLQTPEFEEVNSLCGKFPEDRFFSLVGTNSEDYGYFTLGRVFRWLTGTASDGLVQMNNAFVQGAHRAHVYLSHSGPFGLVNSEEGYKHLVRFLFGDVKITGSLQPGPGGIIGPSGGPRLPRWLESRRDTPANPAYFISTSIAVMGDRHYSERRAVSECSAMLHSHEELGAGSTTRPHLFSLFLDTANEGGVGMRRPNMISIDIEVTTTEDSISQVIHGDSLYRDKVYLLLGTERSAANRRLQISYWMDSMGNWREHLGQFGLLEKNVGGSYLIPLKNNKGFHATLAITVHVEKGRPLDSAAGRSPPSGASPDSAADTGAQQSNDNIVGRSSDLSASEVDRLFDLNDDSLNA